MRLDFDTSDRDRTVARAVLLGSPYTVRKAADLMELASNLMLDMVSRVPAELTSSNPAEAAFEALMSHITNAHYSMLTQQTLLTTLEPNVGEDAADDQPPNSEG